MDDIVLVTADSVRYDYVDTMEFVSSIDPSLGITAGHYTRPSLAGLHSGNHRGVIQSRVSHPSLAQVLAEHGYSCLGIAPSAQLDPAFGFDAGFDRYENFADGGGNAFRNRRSRVREWLGGIDIVRDIYYRLFPMEAILSGLPTDTEVIDKAVDWFNEAPVPRFMWVHLMGSHRPYGRGDDAVPTELDRKATASGSGLFSRELTGDERDRIRTAYRQALRRTDHQIQRLLDGVDGNPVFVFTSDHGDELGEEGYYYHQGYRRRVVDSIVQVPVAFDGLNHDRDELSLLDIPPTLAGAMGIESPPAWQGNNLLETATEQTLTIAPWHGRATVLWQDFESEIVATDAEVTYQSGDERARVGRVEVSGEVEGRLRELGYVDAG